MPPEEEAILLDMGAFIEWSIREGKDYRWVLANLSHDCIGLLKREDCLLPRTTGYYAIMHR
ncbi:hypothetical protein ES703_56204 [subsurface metagenome]